MYKYIRVTTSIMNHANLFLTKLTTRQEQPYIFNNHHHHCITSLRNGYIVVFRIKNPVKCLLFHKY